MRAQRSKFSFRQFAKEIGLTSSNLSDIFKGRCGLSAEGATKIADSLKLSFNEKTFFIDLVESQHARGKAERDAALKRLQEREKNPFKAPTDEVKFSFADRWYFAAVLELVEVMDGLADTSRMAQRLGISETEVAEALSALKSLELVRVEDERYVRSSERPLNVPPAPTAAIRRHHREMLAKAEKALDGQAVENRKFSSIMMTFDLNRIEEAKVFLENMENEFFRRFEAKQGESNSVFALNLNLIRIDQELS